MKNKATLNINNKIPTEIIISDRLNTNQWKSK